MIKPSSVIRIPTSLESFFTNWLLFLKPFHGMTDRQISLAAQFLKVRYELSKSISDEALLDENVMSDTTKKKVREACNVTPAFFQVLMGDLRKHRFIEDGKINPKYIPKLAPSQGIFTLMLYFEIKDNQKENK